MSHIHFAAWGSVNIELMKRNERRRYIIATRERLLEHGLRLECGGQRDNPYYVLRWKSEAGDDMAFAQQGMEAFKAVMAKATELIPAEVTDGVDTAS